MRIGELEIVLHRTGSGCLKLARAIPGTLLFATTFEKTLQCRKREDIDFGGAESPPVGFV